AGDADDAQLSAIRRCFTNGRVRYNKQEVTLGRLADAVADARQSITHADHSGDASTRMANRTTAADAEHHSGRRAEAGTLFTEERN
ncbi:MAG: hypothetical protein WBQ11_01410, partial [Isosphaeraceae bacterium]